MFQNSRKTITAIDDRLLLCEWLSAWT